LPAPSSDGTIEKFSEDTLFQISFGDTSLREIRAKISKKSPIVRCNFNVTKGGKLKALIIPGDSTCNIRINQIIMPGNKSDGPFGKDHEFNLNRSGAYQLIIGQNLMAGSTDGCDFTLRLIFK
jgi:hypothetical protein